MNAVFLFAMGLLILTAGADVLVRGAVKLSVMAGITPLVIGLTVVAFGTSAPELAVSMVSAWNRETDIALGNVVGSNILNLLLVMGLAAAIAPLAVPARLLRVDVPVMIAISLVLWILARDGRIDRGDGLALILGLVAYLGYTVYRGRRRDSLPPADAQPAGGSAGAWARATLLAGIGLVMLTAGAQWMVTGAVRIAAALGVNELIVGLTVVALGTSLPELATSAVAAARGHRDIAVGNVVGSNIFNILAVLGLSSMVADNGLPVSAAVLHFHIPVMVAVAVACVPVFITGGRISRGEGLLFLGYYAAYNGYLVLQILRHPSLALFDTVMLGVVIPLTTAVLIVMMVRELRSQR